MMSDVSRLGILRILRLVELSLSITYVYNFSEERTCDRVLKMLSFISVLDAEN